MAQTCSQIGADSGSLKLTLDKTKSKSETSKSPSKTPKSNTSPQEHRPLAFKPYETNVLTRMGDVERPSSKSSSTNGSVYDEKQKNTNSNSNSARVPSRNKSNSSPELNSAVNNNNYKSESSSAGKQSPTERKSTSPDGSQRGASPIVRSGLEVLHGHSSKDLGAFKPSPYAINPLAALCCPPGMEQHSNPAFRPPFGQNSFSHHHAAMLAAAAGYPSPASQYLSYQRIKTPSGGETVVPVCKDPYCTGCQYSQHNQQMMLGVPCPAGCVQCEQQKFSLAVAMSQNTPNPHYSQLDRPFLCSWMVSDGYCGKRFGSSDELAQHLRLHSSNPADPQAASVLVQAQQRVMAMMHPFQSLFQSPSAMHRGYPAPLSPMSAAARYHPYAKPGSGPSSAGMPPNLAGSPYFNPASLNPAALSPYFSSYAMYSQRLGAAAAAAAAHQ